MLGELPPIVTVPLNPTESLIPVRQFLQCSGLYSTLHARYRDDTSLKLEDGVIHTIATMEVSRQTDSGQPPPPSSSRGDGGSLSLLSRITRGNRIGETKNLLTTSQQGLSTLKVKDVDDLLEVLVQRHVKYASVKRMKTEWYLNRIEVEVDRFLTTHYSRKSSGLREGVALLFMGTGKSAIQLERGSRGGEGILNGIHGASFNDRGLPTLQESFYTANSIPFNYLDVRPENMAAIAGNLVVLRHCLAECITPGSNVWNLLVKPIASSVWEQSLTPLERSARELLMVAEQNVWPPLEHFLLQEHQDNSVEWSERRAKYDHTVKALQGDLKYLQTIYEMDHGAADNPLCVAGEKLSDYVPVSGLVLSRLHRLENEHRTVWEFWRTR